MPGLTFSLDRFLYKLRTTKRYWIPLVLAVSAAVILFGLFVLPRKYEVQAVLLIDKPKLEIMTGAASDLLGTKNNIQQIRLDMNSPAFLATVAKKTNLDVGVEPRTPAYDRIIFNMRRALEVTGNEENATIYITYHADQASKAINTVDEMIRLAIDKFNRTYQYKTDYSEKLITLQLNEARQGLTSATQAVADYKQSSTGLDTDVIGQKQRGLELLLDENNRHKYERSMLDERITLLESQLAQMQKESVDSLTLPSPDVQQLSGQKRELELKLKTLTDGQGFTEKHWQVKELRTQLNIVEDQLKQAKSTAKDQVLKSPNTQYAGLEGNINQYKVEKQGLDSLIANQETGIAQLKTELNDALQRMPGYQGQIASLENKRRLAEDRVATLMKRLDEARTAASFVGDKDPRLNILGPQLILVTPPYLPSPTPSPNPRLILAGGGFAGLGAGILLLYLLTVLDRSVRTFDEARDALRMPVLGVMQRLEGTGRKTGRRFGYGVGLILLLVVLAGVGLYFTWAPFAKTVQSLFG